MTNPSFSITSNVAQIKMFKRISEKASEMPFAFLDIVGKRMVGTHLPATYATAGGHIGESWRTPLRGGSPLVDTGNLRDSWSYTVSGGTLTVFSRNPWARIHHEGRVIRVKTAEWLTFKVNGQWVRKKEVRIPRRRQVKWTAEVIRGDIREQFMMFIEDLIGETVAALPAHPTSRNMPGTIVPALPRNPF